MGYFPRSVSSLESPCPVRVVTYLLQQCRSLANTDRFRSPLHCAANIRSEMAANLAFALFALIALSLATPLHVLPRQDTPRQCNLNPAVCDRKYSNVSYIGTHDSAFVGKPGDPRINQDKTVTQQLDAGIRFLQAQVHDFLGELRMCHTECVLLDAGTLQDYLAEVKDWMDGHVDEVVTMLLVNGDDSLVSDFADVFAASGIDDLAFVPATSPQPLGIDDWPTLADILDSGKRLVTFLSTGANEQSTPYLLSEFDAYFFETPFETTDPDFPSCELDRPDGASADGRMYILNHFLQKEVLPDVFVPDVEANFQTNAATGKGSIGAHVDLCVGKWDRKPNFVLVDMFERGMVFEAQAAMNGF